MNTVTTSKPVTPDPKPGKALTSAQKRAEAKRQRVLADTQAKLVASVDTDAADDQIASELETPAMADALEKVGDIVAGTGKDIEGIDFSKLPRNAITETLKRTGSFKATAAECGITVAKVKAALAVTRAATVKGEQSAETTAAVTAKKAEATAAAQAKKAARVKRDSDIVKMAKAGKSVSEIAKAIELSTARVSGILVDAGLKAPSATRGSSNAERDTDIANAYQGGATMEQLTASFNLSAQRVRNILISADVWKGTTRGPSHPEALSGLTDAQATKLTNAVTKLRASVGDATLTQIERYLASR